MPVTTAHHLRRIATNGVQLNVAIAGDGPAVLLLHGFPHTWQLWSGIMGRLAGQYRVIAPDLRGFGASARAVEGYDAAPSLPTSKGCSTHLASLRQRWSASTRGHRSWH